MTKRIGITVTLALALLGGTAVFAQSPMAGQEPSGPEQGQRAGQGRRMPSPEEQLDRMAQELNLTNDQKEKIKPILEEQAKQFQALRNDSSSTQEDRRAKFQEIRQNTMKQIRPILNGDQQKKFEEMMQRRGGRRQGGSNTE